MSYNILYQGLGPDGHGWADRREAVTAEIRRVSPDIIAFQEVWMEQFVDLRESFPDLSWVAETDTPAHTPIAYRTDLFELIDSGTFWLSPPDGEPGAPAWDATYQRLATYATLDDLGTGKRVMVMNVHFDHEGERARRESVSLVRDRLTTLSGDEKLLAGDFNCQPGDPAYRRTTTDEAGWTALSDARTVAETTDGPPVTYTGFESEPYDSTRIDHIMVSDGVGVERLLTCVPAAEPETKPSDHRPVLADLSY
jgi:endonuclease/exonuclease/phosphatase family metal-dependent hydrolase